MRVRFRWLTGWATDPLELHLGVNDPLVATGEVAPALAPSRNTSLNGMEESTVCLEALRDYRSDVLYGWVQARGDPPGG